MKCFGDLVTCKNKPEYVADIPDGDGKCFNKSTWCEQHMGESFRGGNPYLKPICSRCGSENVSIERRVDGDRICNDCGFKSPNKSEKNYIVTTIHDDRQYKNCMCCVCGTVSKCTPSNDFYSTPIHGEGLVCQRCFHEYLGHTLNPEQSRTVKK